MLRGSAIATALVVLLTTAGTAAAHLEYPLRAPTAKEQAEFQKHRSRAAREAAAQADPSQGSFSAPFTEPTLTDGRASDQDCVTNEDGSKTCKPAAGSLNVLPTGQLLYWNALEAPENTQPPSSTKTAPKPTTTKTR